MLVLATTAATAGPAGATLQCSGQTYVRPFLPWLDPANYVLVPGGSLESSTGWTLQGAAQLVTGNEPWKVNAGTDARSLSLPAGSSATTPPLCVTLLHPTLRFFATGSGPVTSLLRVDAITTVGGLKLVTPVGLVTVGGWRPTLPMLFLTNLVSPVTGTVQFRFTAVGLGASFRIDDVYVDPFKQR
jgi:hypothetical protein